MDQSAGFINSPASLWWEHLASGAFTAQRLCQRPRAAATVENVGGGPETMLNTILLIYIAILLTMLIFK